MFTLQATTTTRLERSRPRDLSRHWQVSQEFTAARMGLARLRAFLSLMRLRWIPRTTFSWLIRTIRRFERSRRIEWLRLLPGGLGLPGAQTVREPTHCLEDRRGFLLIPRASFMCRTTT